MNIIVKDFNLAYTLESGQCFNFKKERENKYFGIIKDKFVIIEQIGDVLQIESTPKIREEDIREYFNLDIDYTKILEIISRDSKLKKLTEKYRGLRVINQDEYECMFSYIISSFNSVTKIKMSIEILSKKLGAHILGDIYSFPRIEILKNASLDILKDAKLGYRDRFVINSAKKIIDENINIYDIKKLDYDTAKKKLKEFDGIGDKVSECIMLYSMNFHNAFPEDVWINRYLKGEFKNTREGKISIQNSFEGFAGWAQLFIYTGLRDKFLD
jgi:N-glycosylase/DNA lyase